MTYEYMRTNAGLGVETPGPIPKSSAEQLQARYDEEVARRKSLITDLPEGSSCTWEYPYGGKGLPTPPPITNGKTKRWSDPLCDPRWVEMGGTCSAALQIPSGCQRTGRFYSESQPELCCPEVEQTNITTQPGGVAWMVELSKKFSGSRTEVGEPCSEVAGGTKKIHIDPEGLRLAGCVGTGRWVLGGSRSYPTEDELLCCPPDWFERYRQLRMGIPTQVLPTQAPPVVVEPGFVAPSSLPSEAIQQQTQQQAPPSGGFKLWHLLAAGAAGMALIWLVKR